MDIMLVDPDPAEQALLKDALHQLYNPLNLVSFSDPLLAVKYAVSNHVDALYAVSRMKRMSGFELGRFLRNFQPDIHLHLIVDSEQEKVDAMRFMADNCILRPVTPEALRQAENEDW